MNKRPSLLDSRILSIRGQEDALPLPALLALLSSGGDAEPLALRPHQQHAWHAFLVQLGALAVQHCGDGTSLPADPDWWRQSLLDLAGDAAEDAWTLVVDDLSRPAFLQTPVPEGSLAGYKNRLESPDDLDVLITAKEHDQKSRRMIAARPEHWLFALVTLQTMQGFLGRGNYGIARMNGGFASRPGLGAAPGLGWGERFRRDVSLLLDLRPSLIEDFGYRENGLALLWLQPWDGSGSRSMQQLDPFFLEVCRRVRLEQNAGQIAGRAGNTEAAFLAAKELKGVTGDPWTPVKTDQTALTVSGSGLNYRLLTDVLFSGDFPSKPALEIRPADGDGPWLIAQVLVRGQGKTDGYHERMLPLPPPVRSFFETPDGLARLGALAKRRVERVAGCARRVLHPAVCALLQSGADKLDLRDRRASRWRERLEREVDRVFFDDLWEQAPASSDEANAAWDRRLLDLARAELEDAIHTAPVPSARRPRAVAAAENRFWGGARKHLSLAFDDPQEAR